MYSVKSNLGVTVFYIWLKLSVLASGESVQGASAGNSTDEVESEQQNWLNTTAAEAAGEEVTEAEATEGEAKEAEEEATEVQTTEAISPTTSAATVTHHNLTRTQALKEWGSHLLATKYMCSLAVLYLALCLFLALQHGPIFVH